MVIPQEVVAWIWFWYQIKAEIVLLTIIPKTHFTKKKKKKSLVPCFVGVPQMIIIIIITILIIATGHIYTLKRVLKACNVNMNRLIIINHSKEAFEKNKITKL